MPLTLSGTALAAGKHGLRLPAQNPRLAPCGSRSQREASGIGQTPSERTMHHETSESNMPEPKLQKSVPSRRSPLGNLARAVGAAVLALSGTVGAANPPEQKPNVVFILADDLGKSDVSCYGQRLWETPHIDRLAEQGMLFTDAYAASSVCSPTRASILTGKYPHRMHMSGILTQNARPYKVPNNAGPASARHCQAG